MIRGTVAIVKLSSNLLYKSHHSLTPLLVVTAHKHYDVASTEAKPNYISKNLVFRSAYDSQLDQDSRPMVLLYSWLVAKAKHIHKYGDFYLTKGYDVLHIKVNPTQLLMPSQAQKVVGQVVDFIQEPIHVKQPILIHGFSVGGYLYGETLVKMMANDAISGQMRERIQGQILDSPVSFEGIPYGVSHAVTPVKILQNILHATIAAYLALMKSSTMEHYVRSQRTFEQNAFQIPTMFFYSLADKIAPTGPIEEVMEKMREKGTQVYAKCWPDSRHVSHYHSYPIEYIDLMTFFLKEIGFLSEEIEEKMKMASSA